MRRTSATGILRPGLALAVGVILAAASGLIAGSAGAATPAAQRIGGADRYETAALAARDTFPSGATVVYIASGQDFPDALTGGPAASFEGGPILLVAPDRIPPATATELRRLQPSRIVVLGGPAAVADPVAAGLAAFVVPGAAPARRAPTAPPAPAAPPVAPAPPGAPVVLTAQGVNGALPQGVPVAPGVERIAGADRFATAAAVSAETFAPDAQVVFIATGLNFPDALSGGAAAGRYRGPLLLVRPDSIPAETAVELRRLRPGTIALLGGLVAVSDQVERSLAAFATSPVVRLQGEDRHATAAAVAAAAFHDPTAKVFVATGANFPDALAGGPAAAVNGAPVLLVPGCVPDVVRAQIDRLNPSTMVVLGGPSAVPVGVESLTACSPPVPNPGDSRSCTDFATRAEAQPWFDRYHPLYGDVAKLDSDNDLDACEDQP